VKNPTPPTGVSTFVPARVTGRYNAARDLKATSRALVKAGNAWASIARCAEILGISPEGFRLFTVDGDPAIACGDVEALGPRFAVPFYQRRLARLQAMLPATQRDLRDLAEMATERCAALIKGVREARKDEHIDEAEYDELDAQALAAEADIAAVRAEIARGRAALRAREGAR